MLDNALKMRLDSRSGSFLGFVRLRRMVAFGSHGREREQ
jgi:hypothetical protein